MHKGQESEYKWYGLVKKRYMVAGARAWYVKGHALVIKNDCEILALFKQ